ncbi:MAG TPA: Wadjet anti-phage system protein JetD domain-containing protein [Tepidisphaeraceae bacterium]|jgi:hypothetical protein|nr:Wadjet anti-phage system protein JetD domain-containing protein [Tepidisphaeraceae bacterium]
MKSPDELKIVFRRRWEAAAKREAYLLGGADAWPIVASIGRPKPKTMASDLGAVKRHVDEWRSVNIGEVVWEVTSFRAASAPVEMPLYWRIRQPTEWVAACDDRAIRAEFESMSVFFEETDACFHSLLVSKRYLWRDKAIGEILQATRLALALKPLCANGKPLRTLSVEGIDTKFFERNSRLITALLDVRFDGEVSRIGLETFLGAISDGDHWLLLTDLDGSLLPFRKQRVRSSELKNTRLPGKRLLIVENESCQYHLPDVPETVAVLGAGFDLGWVKASWLQSKQIGYWGDIDTWGLQFLATARQSLAHIDSLMMTPEIYEQNQDAAVPEPIVAGTQTPAGLNDIEQALYKRILKESRGRLEQEFLPLAVVHEAIRCWCDC